MRLTEFYGLAEATAHAWQNLGVSPELRKEIENNGGNQHAYEDAIAFLPLLARELQRRPGTDPVQIFQMAMEYDENYVPIVYNTISKSEKFRAELRKRSHEIKKAGTAGYEMVLKLADQFPPPLSQKYNEDETLLDLGGGWRWVQVSKENCEDEGQLMQHCGDAQFNMASLRDPQGKPHVTADLNFDYKAIRQLKGKQNAVIDEKYWDACGQLFKHLGEQSKRMWQFDDNLYLRSQKGIDFLEFLNEFKYAFTGWDKQLMNPGNVQVPDDDQAWDHFDNGN